MLTSATIPPISRGCWPEAKTLTWSSALATSRTAAPINWRLRRILLSWLANRFAARLLGVPAHDMTSGFRLYRADALRRIDLDAITSTGYSFLVELLYLLDRSGASIAETPIIFTDRTMGKPKLGTREIDIGAFHLITMRLTAGRRRRGRIRHDD